VADRGWWVTAIQWSLWGVAMAAIMGWLGRNRLKRRAESDSHRLVHPLSTLIVGAVGFGFFVALAVLSNLYPNETATWWTTTIFLGLALLSVPIVMAYFIDKHDVSESGLVFTTLLGARKSMRWEEVRSLRYGPVMKWFVVEANTGEVARISIMLMGLPEFARLALARVPVGAVQAPTLEVLRATAGGNPPSIWN
jgi:hypothetical protein